jgi:hypothetical protein
MADGNKTAWHRDFLHMHEEFLRETEKKAVLLRQ